MDAKEEEEEEREHQEQKWKYCCHENDTKSKYGGTEAPRDVVGYGATPVKPHWPRSAKVALNFVIHYEEGGEMCTLHGDNSGDGEKNERNLNIESMYDYGSRCGFWRLHRLFTSRKVPVTVWAAGMALERNMEVVGAIKQQEEWEVSSHGYRSGLDSNINIDEAVELDEAVEREHIQRSIQIHKNLFGKNPTGLYQGQPTVNTRRLAVEEGVFLYDSDAYNDDLPYWSLLDYNDNDPSTSTGTNNNNNNNNEGPKPHLIIPYTLDENDMSFITKGPVDFLNHLKRTLDYMILEGRAGQPKMMSVGLHCRLSRPGHVAAMTEFVDYAKSYGRECWITTRESIANHWYENHLPRGCGNPIIVAGSRRSGGGGKRGGRGSSSPSSSTPTSAESPSSRFSFLGNLKAPRNSQQFKDSLTITKSESEDDNDDYDEDVI